jgi:hypothetical protein
MIDENNTPVAGDVAATPAPEEVVEVAPAPEAAPEAAPVEEAAQ